MLEEKPRNLQIPMIQCELNAVSVVSALDAQRTFISDFPDWSMSVTCNLLLTRALLSHSRSLNAMAASARPSGKTLRILACSAAPYPTTLCPDVARETSLAIIHCGKVYRSRIEPWDRLHCSTLHGRVSQTGRLLYRRNKEPNTERSHFGVST